MLDAFQQINASKQKQEEQDKQKDSSAAAADQQQQQQDVQTQQLLKNVAAATPHVEQAITHFQQATEQLEKDALHEVLQQQTAGLQELTKAWEFFLDIRR